MNTMAESTENADSNVDYSVASDLKEDFVTLEAVDDEIDNEENEESRDALDNNSFRSGDLPPWMDRYVDFRRTNHLVALHNEIVGFCKLMEPHEDEMKEREKLVEQFTELVQSTFDNCQVDVFGSQATGLCLPSSDIDIAIHLIEEGSSKENGVKEEGKDSKQDETILKQQEMDDMENWDKPSGSPLHRLAEALRGKWTSDLSYLEVIENTRVPLVKFTHGPSNISVDVCFNQKTGEQVACCVL